MNRQVSFLPRPRAAFYASLGFSLLFLLAGSTPALFNLPGLGAFFTGVKTTALATATQSCGDGEISGWFFTLTFTDLHEEQQHITNTTVCSSGILHDGERVTIWYQPDDPSHLITANDLWFDALFFLGFSLPFLIFLGFSLFALVRHFARWAKSGDQRFSSLS